MKEKVGLNALFALIFVGITSKLVYLDAHSLSQDPGNPAWMLPLLGGILAAGMLAIMIFISNRSGELTMAMKQSFGNVVGGLLLLVIVVVLLYEVSYITHDSASHMRQHLYLTSEDAYFVIAYLITMLCVAVTGITGIVRVARFASIMLAVGLITTLLLNIKNLEFFRLFPFLGSGVENIAIHSLRFSDTFYPIIAVILFGPFLGSGKLSGKVAYKALGWGVLMLTVTILCMSMTLSDNSYTQVLSPLYYIMSLIDFGRFFDMVDPLFLFGWLTGIAVSGGFLICAISTLITRFFHTKHYRITCFIVTAAAIVMSLLLDEQIFIPYSFFKDYAWALLYAPFVLLFIANIRRKPIENR